MGIIIAVFIGLLLSIGEYLLLGKFFFDNLTEFKLNYWNLSYRQMTVILVLIGTYRGLKSFSKSLKEKKDKDEDKWDKIAELYIDIFLMYLAIGFIFLFMWIFKYILYTYY